MTPLIAIPARLGSERLPFKPTALLAGKPLLWHVIDQALGLNKAPVMVAVDSQNLAETLKGQGIQAVYTDPDLPSGSDRIWHALQSFDPEGHFQLIINLQGDLPIFPAHHLETLLTPHPTFLLNTLAMPLTKEEENDPHVVKAILRASTRRPASHASSEFVKAEHFSRTLLPAIPRDQHWHHLGVYAYQRHALETFVNTAPSALEKKEKLEQLRAKAIGLEIGVARLPREHWLSVDTPENLQEAERFLKKRAAS